MLLGPQHVADGAKQAHREQDAEQQQDLHVGQLVYAGSLQGHHGGVAHQLGLVARVDDDAEDPGGVAQHGASQQDLVGTQRLCSGLKLEVRLLFVQFLLKMHIQVMANVAKPIKEFLDTFLLVLLHVARNLHVIESLCLVCLYKGRFSFRTLLKCINCRC